jgi:hypothetical protein
MIMAIILAFFMLGLPSLGLGNHGDSLGAVGNAAAAGINDRIYTLGWIDFLGDMGTLNPFTWTMTAEYIVLFNVYSTLLMYDYEKTGEIIGDLAYNYSQMPDGMTWKLDLAPNAYWCDPLTPSDKSHPVTWQDVAWVFWEVNNNTKNYYHSYLPSILDGVWPDAGNPRTLYIKTTYPYAPFVDCLTSIPILPKYYWDTVGDHYRFNGVRMIGSGAFYYNSSSLPTTECRLQRNPIWHHEANRGWQVHDGQFVIRNEADATTALIELKARIIDTMTTVPPPIYLNEVDNKTNPIPNVFGVAQGAGFVYEFNMNQMTDAMRAQLKWSGSNNQLLLNPIVKEAMQRSVNKEAFVDTVLLGLGEPGDSLVPYNNPWHYAYGVQPGTGYPGIIGDRAPVGEEPYVFDPLAVRSFLNANGWSYDRSGNPATLTTVPLCQVGGTNPLSFKMYSILPEPEWKLGTDLITQDMATAGILLHGRLKEADPPDFFSVNFMNTVWKTANYDCWLWDWYMSPILDPSTGIMSVFITDEIGNNQDVFYSNATYDNVYNLSLRATDPAGRMVLTDELQRMAYINSGCDAVAYRKELFALNDAYWTRYGDWERYFLLMADQATPWLHTRMWAVDNNAPEVAFGTTYIADINVPKSMSVTAVDDHSSPMDVKYFWGDGTVSPWVSYSSGGGTQSHPYTKDGVYTVYVAAREIGTADGFSGWNRTTVTVRDMNNYAPIGVSISMIPTDPDTGTNVTLTATATDPESDVLTYSWNFGDLTTAYGQTTYHQWTQNGDYDVLLSVTDNHIGNGTRPVESPEYVVVTQNSPPSLSINSRTGLFAKQSYTFYATGSDSNPRDTLRYTWVWGDGTRSVTSVNNSVHTYDRAKIYTMTVSLDDLTGLPLHNVTKTAQAEVITSGNNIPVISAFTVSKSNPYTGETVMFTGTAKDANKDFMQFTFAFGDGTYGVVSDVGGVDNKDHTATFNHSYATGGSKTAYLYVSDGQLNATSSALPLSIVANDAPIVDPLSDIYETPNVAIDFVANAFDPDGDDITFWWDFGDGTPMVLGDIVQHTYTDAGDYNFAVYVYDGIGNHNTSQSAWAYINDLPVVTPLADQTFTLGVSMLVTVSATDPDGDTLFYTWSFGDSTPAQTGASVYHTYTITGSYTMTVYVDDLWPASGHNVSSTATATVEFTITLVVGWNFVSIPIVGHAYMASTLGLLDGDIVAGWNPATGFYDQNFIVGFPLGDFAISESTGYWINAGTAETLQLEGSVPASSQVRTITVPTGGGWVIVGFESLNTARHASDIPAMYSVVGGIDQVASYDTATGDYISYIVGFPLNDFALVPGQAYWCLCTASGVLTYEP